MHDTTASGTAVTAASLLAACTCCCVPTLILGPLEPTFENGHGIELYDAAVYGTTVPALTLRSNCMYGICPLGIAFEVVRGVEL